MAPRQSLAIVAPPVEGWAALVEHIARGDTDAFAALYDGTCRLVHGLVLRIVRDPGAAEEVTADVYLQIWRQAARYDAGRGTPLSWLTTVARSRALDRRRTGGERHQSEPLAAALELPTTLPGPEESSVVAERRRLVRGALGSLGAEQRRAIELAYYAGLSHSEIAATLDEPLGTVKTRIRLAMVRLRAALARCGRESP